MGHRCFGNYEPGHDCRACIEQKKCIESMSKKKPGRPRKTEKAAAGPAENKALPSEPEVKATEPEPTASDSLL